MYHTDPISFSNILKDIPARKLPENVLQEAYHYLNETDYIVTKIAEAQALGIDIEPDLIKYEQELTKREEARETIRELR